jgi:PhoH-like ATPase
MPLPKAPSKPATLLDFSLAKSKINLSPTPEPEPPAAAAPKSSHSVAKQIQQIAAIELKKPIAKAPQPAPQPVRPANQPTAKTGGLSDLAKKPRQRATSNKKNLSGTDGQTTKLFVLDTNVLMHDPSCLFRFAEHDVYLPMMTLEELDDHKKGMSEVSRNARQVSRSLDQLVRFIPTW